MNTYSSVPLTPLSLTPFLKEGNEIFKKLNRESNFLKNQLPKPKVGNQKKCKGHRETWLFDFHILPISYDDK